MVWEFGATRVELVCSSVGQSVTFSFKRSDWAGSRPCAAPQIAHLYCMWSLRRPQIAHFHVSCSTSADLRAGEGEGSVGGEDRPSTRTHVHTFWLYRPHAATPTRSHRSAVLVGLLRETLACLAPQHPHG